MVPFIAYGTSIGDGSRRPVCCAFISVCQVKSVVNFRNQNLLLNRLVTPLIFQICRVRVMEEEFKRFKQWMLESSSPKEPTVADYQKFKAARDPPEGGKLVLSLVPRLWHIYWGESHSKYSRYLLREKWGWTFLMKSYEGHNWMLLPYCKQFGISTVLVIEGWSFGMHDMPYVFNKW